MVKLFDYDHGDFRFQRVYPIVTSRRHAKTLHFYAEKEFGEAIITKY